MAGRLKRMGQARYQVDGDPRTSGPGFGVQAHADLIDLPRRWKRPRLVFVNSMSDLFHARIPVDVVKRVLATMEATPQHTYQILTKRSTRLRRLAPQLQWPSNVWMGVSVENQDYAYRVDDLRAVPAAVRFIPRSRCSVRSPSIWPESGGSSPVASPGPGTARWT